MTDDQGAAGGAARAHLLTSAVDARVGSIEAHRIDLRPGRHVQPGVVGHLVDGAPTFQVDGRIGGRRGIPGSPTLRRTA